jgi:hypothetical protein
MEVEAVDVDVDGPATALAARWEVEEVETEGKGGRAGGRVIGNRPGYLVDECG